MATYTLISSNVLSSSAASVTFSSIPATYTDLVLRASTRTDNANVSTAVKLYFNNVTTDTSATYIEGNGATVISGFPSAPVLIFRADGATATSNTFGNAEIYIPSYTNTTAKKPVSSFGVHENNATTAYIDAVAALNNSNSAISRIDLDGNGANFVSGSSFYLYGISNA
jgi:hypothetical protein